MDAIVAVDIQVLYHRGENESSLCIELFIIIARSSRLYQSRHGQREFIFKRYCLPSLIPSVSRAQKLNRNVSAMLEVYPKVYQKA